MGQACTTCHEQSLPAASSGVGMCTSAPLVDLKDDMLTLSQTWVKRSEAVEECDLDPSTDESTAASSSSGLGNNNVKKLVELDPAEYHMQKLPLSVDIPVFDINLHEGAVARRNVERYYTLCKSSLGLHVTTSCFSPWRMNKKTNGHAKIIPVHPTDPEAVRTFFFDDNLEWGGQESSPGICNLRDARTGDFVGFAEGQNGFVRERAARHTVIFHSEQYRVVLVKANILDAMEDNEYFASIVERFSKPGEKFCIYMDVNSTIVCNDTIQGKNLGSTLLSTMFEFIELRPHEPYTLSFDSHPAIRIEKPKNFKTIVKEITADSHESYGAFWTEERCWDLFCELDEVGDVSWSGDDGVFTFDACQTLFQEYLVSLGRSIKKDGIAPSWFRVYEKLKNQHAIILNSFGVDTRKVILATMPCEQAALQVTVNHELWEARDMQKFEGQFMT